MQTKYLAARAGVLAITLTVGCRLVGAQDSAGRSGDLSATASPQSVVVELFTSEGCSDCPPADAVLAKLERSGAVRGVKVIALGEHVDYWNRLGWRDPHSDAYFSGRQSAYATAFHNDQVYTPQMVVQGKAEFVGSDESRARAEIARAAEQAAHPNVPLTVTVRALPDQKVQVDVEAPATPGAHETGELYLAVTQDGLSSAVASGENAGHTLHHAAVVRLMNGLARYNSASGIAKASQTVALLPQTNPATLHVAAFIQRDNAGAILSAAQVDLANLAVAPAPTANQAHH